MAIRLGQKTDDLGALIVPGVQGYVPQAKKVSPVAQISPTTKPVTSLSTGNAQQTLATLKQRLEEISANLTKLKPETPAPTEKATVPKATFVNESGQEATYTQEQLNDPNIQQFLQSGGYAMSNTEGPTLQAGALTQADRQIDNLAGKISTYNVESDPQYLAMANQIKGKYARLKEETQNLNYQRAQSLQTLGFRYGTTQYAGGVQQGIETSELQQADNRLSEVDAQEQSALAGARAAIQEGKYAEFSMQMASLEKVRENKREELENYNKALDKAMTQAREEIKQDKLQTGVLTLLNEGIIDPIQILTELQMAGVEATPDDVKKYTSLIANSETLAGLSTDFRTYEFLKDNRPEELKTMGVNSYQAYLSAVKNAQRVSGGGSDFTTQEKKKLEQKGLADAPRQEQLDFLYGNKGGIDFNDL